MDGIRCSSNESGKTAETGIIATDGRKKTVVIADDEFIFLMNLEELLALQGFDVVGKASDGFECIELCKNNRPDVVLIDIKMPNLDGISAARYIYNEDLADTIVIVSAYEESEFVNKAAHIGVAGYLVKPVNEKNLVPCITVAMARSKELRLMKNEIKHTRQELIDRKLIERAKGLIMEENHFTEQQAFDYIRQISKTGNISMVKAAELLLKRIKIS